MTLEEYFAKNEALGLIDHSLRAQRSNDGGMRFYIHPARASGDTLDFIVTGNTLTPAGWAKGFEA